MQVEVKDETLNFVKENNNMEKVYAMVILLIVLSFIIDKVLKNVREKKINV